MAGTFFTGAMLYERDYDLSQVNANFRVLTDTINAPPSVIATAYLGCIGTPQPQGCRACYGIDPRHFIWIGVEAAGQDPQQHKVPVNLLTNLGTCFAALETAGVTRCITYKGESFRNIHRLL